jgi:hypothetical protein
MPLIVVGADTPAGEDILARLDPSEREVRVFVTDESTAIHLKQRGFKVATGDVSDESHVEAATTSCFSAVLIAEAASDDRERSFARRPADVLGGWARAVSNSGVKRVIWVSADLPPETRVEESAVIDPADPGLVESVIALDDARSID